jgi:hypothetical protein
MNPMHDKDFTPMETQSPASGRSPRCPAPGGQFPAALRIDGYALSLAADLPALEACLALERACGAPASEGIHSPQAVPYCDFLMLRNPQGALSALCRLMRLDGGNPIPNPLAAGRFQLSPLLTALRYSREGILEMGAPVFAPGTALQAAARAARLLWAGMGLYLERNGPGFVIGRDVLAVPAGTATGWQVLMAEHGLHPDLETEARPGYRAREDVRDQARRGSAAFADEPLRFWPAGLQEALLRGCRLACEPAYDPASAGLEFVWVASRDMLLESGDWRRTTV